MADLIGLDCASDCTTHAGAIKTAGLDFVGRYYRWPSSRYKPLTHAEAVALTQAGLNIVALWEWASDKIGNFSYHDGLDQGTSAYRQAMTAHQPSGTPIYFAADSDFSASQIAGPIADYFRGVADAFKAMGTGSPVYLPAIYGSGLTCNWLVNHGLAARSWLAVSSGWTGHATFQTWDLNQGAKDFGIDGLKGPSQYDSDTAKADTYGGFKVLA